MIKLLSAFLTAFAVCIVLLPFNIRISKRLKAGQPILHYVDKHKSKSGTPTMGGISIILTLFTTFIFAQGFNRLLLIAVAVTAGYGIIGFMDDFIKVHYKHNEGLNPIQKIFFQLVIAGMVSIFAYYSADIGDTVFAPFKLVKFSMGVFSMPYYILIFLAFTNSVNLTDGLDGLAASVTVIFLIFMLAIMLFCGQLGLLSLRQRELTLLFATAIGALLAFLMFNSHPASIFMGDTGSMALGGLLASLAILTSLSLNILALGIMYILTSLSVIIQVGYFKMTKGKRVFLMAPLHHHFEKKGLHESKIVTIYAGITFIMGIISIMLVIFFN